MIGHDRVVVVEAAETSTSIATLISTESHLLGEAGASEDEKVYLICIWAGYATLTSNCRLYHVGGVGCAMANRIDV